MDRGAQEDPEAKDAQVRLQRAPPRARDADSASLPDGGRGAPRAGVLLSAATLPGLSGPAPPNPSPGSLSSWDSGGRAGRRGVFGGTSG